MKQAAWINSTTAHPAGVCEAATALWLARIGKHGIGNACKLAPEDCDALQTQAEDVGEHGWSFDSGLLPMLPTGSTFDPWKGAVDCRQQSDVSKLLKGLKPAGFAYVSCQKANGNGHAMAFYRSPSSIYYFDPNRAFYVATSDAGGIGELAKQFIDNVTQFGFGTRTAFAGRMPQHYGAAGRIDLGASALL